jgi:hypothetical protein
MGTGPDKIDPVAQVRRMSTEDLTKLGEDSLKQRLLEQAVFAHQKYGPLTAGNLEAFLGDADCVRYPTRLAFEFGEMAMHQFAQPDVDHRQGGEEGRVLYLRPLLRERPDLLPLAVAYMLPVINYGEVIGDEHCLLYGATLMGLMEAEFCEQICAMADCLGCGLPESS